MYTDTQILTHIYTHTNTYILRDRDKSLNLLCTDMKCISCDSLLQKSMSLICFETSLMGP